MKSKYTGKRPTISADIKRAIAIESGHACAIKGCNEHTYNEYHHIDGNRENNKLENLIYLCDKHHKMSHSGEIDCKALKEYKKINLTSNQNYNTRINEINKNRDARESLRIIACNFIVSCNLIALQHGARANDESHFFDCSHDAIEKITKALCNLKINKNSDSVLELVLYIKNHKSQLEAALPIAAQIDSSTLLSWSTFLTHINIINSSDGINTSAIFNALESLRWLGMQQHS